jgi:hypothetical protein
VGPDGRIAVVGDVKRAQLDFDPWIGVLDEGGATLWSDDVVHPASNDTATGIAFDDAGGVAFASLLTPAGETHTHVTRYDADGVQSWDEEYPLGYDATGIWPIGPALTHSQGAHALVFTEALPDQTGQSWIRWYEADGALRSHDLLPPERSPYGAGATDDGILVTGSDRSDPKPDELWAGRFAADGSEQWSASCGPTLGRDVVMDSAGDIIAAGYDVETENVARVCKFAADGTAWWKVDLPLGVPGLAYGVAVGPGDEIYVVGELHPGPAMEEAWIAKLTP